MNTETQESDSKYCKDCMGFLVFLSQHLRKSNRLLDFSGTENHSLSSMVALLLAGASFVRCKNLVASGIRIRIAKVGGKGL